MSTRTRFEKEAKGNSEMVYWDKHFDDLMERAVKRMYILRVCKRNGYSVSDLDYLLNCLIMSLFTYCIRVWGVATYTIP